ncbi:Leucine-rich repeat protein kinase family protein [Prunus dulcis]|uniref:Leucine-rich repeat protein kinase family protein n=1 Tax=Prunus dulcis TaxID=3755 RepID=A0A4Y1QNF3_PRUDU|nr:Leucine-rich repeat protein kinase family protein [Prunus dulcis]
MVVSRGVGYPALRQAPYVALVVPAYGEIVRYCVEVARGVGLAWRRLSGVETDPIRGVGCTGVWGDYVEYREVK